MRIAVVGLGKLGTALAAHFASKGHTITGCDVNQRTIDLINAGLAPVQEEPGVQVLIAGAVAAGRLSATSDTAAAVRSCTAVVIVVPLLVDEQKRVDYRAIDNAVGDIARGLQPNTLVTFETTLPVGAVRDRFGPLLERGSGLQAGKDFWLAFGPERVQSGRILRDLETYPKVIGGVDRASTEAASAFYRQVLDVPLVEVGSLETAEFVKLAQSFYRDVNIALANELAKCADACGVDVLEAIRVANTDPYSHIHQPGIGVGGHCMPVYPYFFINRFSSSDLLRMARSINDGMAAYGVALLEQEIGSLHGQHILILGLAFRANVKEATLSMAHLIASDLERRGAVPLVHDPLFTADEIRAWGLQPTDLQEPGLFDALIVQAYHDDYRTLDFSRFTRCRAVLDGRNALADHSLATLPGRHLSIGRPVPPQPTDEAERNHVPSVPAATGARMS